MEGLETLGGTSRDGCCTAETGCSQADLRETRTVSGLHPELELDSSPTAFVASAIPAAGGHPVWKVAEGAILCCQQKATERGSAFVHGCVKLPNGTGASDC